MAHHVPINCKVSQDTKTFPKCYVGRNGKQNQQKLTVALKVTLKLTPPSRKLALGSCLSQVGSRKLSLASWLSEVVSRKLALGSCLSQVGSCKFPLASWLFEVVCIKLPCKLSETLSRKLPLTSYLEVVSCKLPCWLSIAYSYTL